MVSEAAFGETLVANLAAELGPEMGAQMLLQIRLGLEYFGALIALMGPVVAVAEREVFL